MKLEHKHHEPCETSRTMWDRVSDPVGPSAARLLVLCNKNNAAKTGPFHFAQARLRPVTPNHLTCTSDTSTVFTLPRPRNSTSARRIKVASLGQGLLSIEDEVPYALDDFCDSVSAVVTRAGQLVHDGWIHPHSFGGRGRCASDSAHNRSQTSGLTQSSCIVLAKKRT